MLKWISWTTGSIRYRFAILFFLLLLHGFLFVTAKSEWFPLSVKYLSFLPFGYHAPWIVSTILVLALGISFWGLVPYGCSFPSILSRGRVILVFLFLMLSIFPMGFYWKYHSFFYEKWMWMCVFWVLGMGISFVLAQEIVFFHPSILRKSGDFFQKMDRFLSCSDPLPGDRILLGVLCGIGFVGTLSIQTWVLEGIPHVYDEIAQCFQAKVFSHGFLSMPAPRETPFFERMYIPIENGKWYSIYPPGFALILAIGVIFNHPGWMNPLISMSLIPLFFAFANRISSRYVARLGSIFLVFSPFFLFMGGSFMNHPSCLLFLLLYLYFLQGAILANSNHLPTGTILLSGFCAGIAFLIRPMTAVAALGTGFVWAMMQCKNRFHRGWKLSALFFLAFLPSFLFFLYFNEQTTGSLWITGYQHYFDANPLGFGEKPWGPHPLGPQIPRGETHTPGRGMANTLCNLNAMQAYLFGWPVPSLLFAFLLFLPGLHRKPVDNFCWITITTVCGVYFFYFFQDICFGPRFLYETIPFWILLTVRGIEEIKKGWIYPDRLAPPQIQGLLYGLLIIYFGIAIGTFWIARIAEYSNDYWGTRDELPRLLREGIDEEDAVILIEDPNDHLAVFFLLDPALDRGWIIAHDLGSTENHRLLRHYPEWPVYRLRLKEDENTHEIQNVLERIQRSSPKANRDILGKSLAQ